MHLIAEDMPSALKLCKGRVIVLDTETTGAAVEAGHRIIELGMLEMFDLRRTGREMRLLFNPQRAIDPDATSVHGISDHDVAECPTFAEKIDEISAFIGDGAIAAHNAPFDLSFLDAEWKYAGRVVPSRHAIDTLPIARIRNPGARANLDALADRLGVNRAHREKHGALIDASILADCLIKLAEERIYDLFAVENAPNARTPSDATRLDRQQMYQRTPRPVQEASFAELAAHSLLIERLSKAAPGKVIWSPND